MSSPFGTTHKLQIIGYLDTRDRREETLPDVEALALVPLQAVRYQDLRFNHTLVALDQEELMEDLMGLIPAQFNEVVYRMSIYIQTRYLGSDQSPQVTRSIDLLALAKQHDEGMLLLRAAVNKVQGPG